mgnify:CR=1 FL=1
MLSMEETKKMILELIDEARKPLTEKDQRAEFLEDLYWDVDKLYRNANKLPEEENIFKTFRMLKYMPKSFNNELIKMLQRYALLKKSKDETIKEMIDLFEKTDFVCPHGFEFGKDAGVDKKLCPQCEIREECIQGEEANINKDGG